MAVWQATLEFLSTTQFPADYRDQLSDIAPPLPSWATDLEMWGTEDGNRVDVWIEHGRPMAARVRFDLRDPSEHFRLAIVGFAAGAGTGFRTETGLEVSPQLSDLEVALTGSRAARFIEDPTRYLNRLCTGGLDDV